MSSHPNVILMVSLTPDELARKTYRDILSEYKVEHDDDLKIGDKEYHHLIMESKYNEGFQIYSKEGDIVFFDLVTYGYGDVVSWQDLEKQKIDLEKWAKEICKNHHCSYKISVSANYW